jgi:hypothetical protein
MATRASIPRKVAFDAMSAAARDDNPCGIYATIWSLARSG